jgi:hypothetical protein
VLLEESHIPVYFTFEEARTSFPFEQSGLKYACLGLITDYEAEHLLQLSCCKLLIEKTIAEVAVSEYSIYSAELLLQGNEPFQYVLNGRRVT